jgi:hypothetical protein
MAVYRVTFATTIVIKCDDSVLIEAPSEAAIRQCDWKAEANWGEGLRQKMQQRGELKAGDTFESQLSVAAISPADRPGRKPELVVDDNGQIDLCGVPSTEQFWRAVCGLCDRGLVEMEDDDKIRLTPKGVLDAEWRRRPHSPGRPRRN